MEIITIILSPDFLLRNSIYISVLVGLVCPLVGVFLVVRRLVFMGVALPQISSTGVAVALSIPMWFGFKLTKHGSHSHSHLANHSSNGTHSLAFAGSVSFSLVAILMLAFLERRGRGQPEGRLGTAYVVASALSMLLLAKNPYGEIGWLDMMKGEVITISDFDLMLTAATLSLVVATLALFHKELLLVSFDRETAIIMRKKVVFWDVLLYVLIGLTVSMAVLSVGPLIAFGFLLIPALTAHLFARNMRMFSIMASLIGGVAAFTGFCIAYKWDLPVGPTDVVLLGVLYAIAWIVAKIVHAGGVQQIAASLARMLYIMLGIKIISDIIKRNQPINLPIRQGGPMLEVNNLKVGHDGEPVMELPHLSLSSGEHCLILGASGSGKTTLLSTLSGLLAPLDGEILLEGHNFNDLQGSAMDEFRGRNIGIIYQTLHMVGALTVLENLYLAQYAAGLPLDRDKAISLLEHLGIDEKKDDKPETLSQGQQQRVAIARAAINSPKIIIGDEPTSALDDNSCETVMDLLLKLAAASNASLVIATHDQRIKHHFHKQITLGGAQ